MQSAFKKTTSIGLSSPKIPERSYIKSSRYIGLETRSLVRDPLKHNVADSFWYVQN